MASCPPRTGCRGAARSRDAGHERRRCGPRASTHSPEHAHPHHERVPRRVRPRTAAARSKGPLPAKAVHPRTACSNAARGRGRPMSPADPAGAAELWGVLGAVLVGLWMGGVFALTRFPKTPLSKTFRGFGLCAALWALGDLLGGHASDF